MGDAPHERGPRGYDLDRFLADLRRTGTVVTGPVSGQPVDEWSPAPVEWLVSAHRGQPVDPPYRLELDGEEWAAALAHDAETVRRWWPGGDPAGRAYEALLLSLDAALVGVDRTPHRFLLEEDGRLHLTTHHPCPDPLPHLDPDAGPYFWTASEPGTPEFEEELARNARRSRHRRHADLVRAWLAVEAAMGSAQVDPAVIYLQDQVDAAFGPGTMQRFSAHVDSLGLADAELDRELAALAQSDDERLDALLDALAGEPRDG
ncbi:hypothetical protein [Blastococcus sp. SYSU D00820]